MPLTLCDPTAQPALETVTLAPRPGNLRGRRLGLIQNGKHNADKLLDGVFSLLEPELSPAEVVRRSVPTTAPASEEFLDELAAECDLAILAVGD
jgi:hypothetical protein